MLCSSSLPCTWVQVCSQSNILKFGCITIWCFVCLSIIAHTPFTSHSIPATPAALHRGHMHHTPTPANPVAYTIRPTIKSCTWVRELACEGLPLCVPLVLAVAASRAAPFPCTSRCHVLMKKSGKWVFMF